MWRKLKVYVDATHPHQAQKPAQIATLTKNKSKREVA